MARLGEFVGALLADAVQARVRADVESLKVAEAYSGHELLKRLPVPRFRVPDITVDFPVVVTGLQGPGEGSAGKLFEQPSSREIAQIVTNAVDAAAVPLSAQQRTQLAAAVQKRSTDLFKSNAQALLRSHQISRELGATAAGEIVKALPGREDAPALARAVESSLRNSTRALLTQKIAQSPHLQVNVASGEIKNHGDNDSVVRVRLTITEDAYEVIERDDESGFTLVPE